MKHAQYLLMALEAKAMVQLFLLKAEAERGKLRGRKHGERAGGPVVKTGWMPLNLDRKIVL